MPPADSLLPCSTSQVGCAVGIFSLYICSGSLCCFVSLRMHRKRVGVLHTSVQKPAVAPTVAVFQEQNNHHWPE